MAEITAAAVDPERLGVLAHSIPIAPAPAAQTAELDQLRAEIDELRADRDREHNEALRAIGALEAVRRERATLAGQLGEIDRLTASIPEADDAPSTVHAVRAALEAVTARANAARFDTDNRQHRHAWEWQPGLDPMPLPCSCGMPWPRPRPPELATVVPHRKPKGSTR